MTDVILEEHAETQGAVQGTQRTPKGPKGRPEGPQGNPKRGAQVLHEGIRGMQKTHSKTPTASPPGIGPVQSPGLDLAEAVPRRLPRRLRGGPRNQNGARAHQRPT